MRASLTLAVLLAALCAAPSLRAQAASPETHVVTVTYVQMPFDVVRDFMAYADSTSSRSTARTRTSWA
jgi:hypothetical protein